MVEYFDDATGVWRFRIKDFNGEIVSTSVPYTTEVSARAGFHTLCRIINRIVARD